MKKNKLYRFLQSKNSVFFILSKKNEVNVVVWKIFYQSNDHTPTLHFLNKLNIHLNVDFFYLKLLLLINKCLFYLLKKYSC